MKTLLSRIGSSLTGVIAVLALAVASTTTAHADTFFFHNDHLGTPQVVTAANQQVAWQAEYNPFGEVTETVSIIEQNLRFPGQYFDTESGLYYNYFRDYDPSTGRYVESDPIGLNGGFSTYGYAYSSPTQFTDQTGLCPWCVAAVAVAAVHWTRNMWNRVPDFETVNENWKKAKDRNARFHNQNGATGNKKYTSPWGFSEAVFCEGNLVEDSLNKGTFNFAPEDFALGIPHGIVDILPWLILGNGPVSMFTNAPERLSSASQATHERVQEFGGQLRFYLQRNLTPAQLF